MIRRSMKKVLAGIVASMYLMIYAAPLAFCVTSVPKIEASVNKPVLRKSAPVVAKAVPSAPTALKLEGEISITKGNPKTSLSLRDSDVQQVLRMFADKAGLNIIFHSSVSGKVTMDLVNVPLNDAFKMVMQVSDLTYYVDKNTMVVAASSAAKDLNLSKQEMIAIPVKYTDAGIMADFLNKNIFSINSPGLSNSQIAITNPGANEVLIFGTDNDARIARKVIAKFDIKAKDTTFVVNHTTPKEMADLICNVLLQNTAGGSTGSAAGVMTGAAEDSSSSSSSSSSSDSDSSSSSSSSSSDGLTLGGATIACKYGNKVTAGNLSSLNNNSISVAYFAQHGTINVMGGSEQQINMIKEFIKNTDKKQPQAYLELSIIELNEGGTKSFNNTWNINSNFFSGTFNGQLQNNAINPMFFKGDSVPVYNSAKGSVPNQVLYYLTQNTSRQAITYTMSYLLQNNKGRVLANPRIMITNGQSSTIDLTSDYVKTVTSQVIQAVGSQNATVQKTYEIGNDDGIKIELTPFISPDGYVTLNIKPEYATIKDQIYTKSTTGDVTTEDLAATLLSRRSLDLKNIRIKDGETLVIGGMMREQETKDIDKFPVLGDLPGIGMFFRNTNTVKSKQELVIMITPKIIKDSEDVVNNSGTAL